MPYQAHSYPDSMIPALSGTHILQGSFSALPEEFASHPSIG